MQLIFFSRRAKKKEKVFRAPFFSFERFVIYIGVHTETVGKSRGTYGVGQIGGEDRGFL